MESACLLIRGAVAERFVPLVYNRAEMIKLYKQYIIECNERCRDLSETREIFAKYSKAPPVCAYTIYLYGATYLGTTS